MGELNSRTMENCPKAVILRINRTHYSKPSVKIIFAFLFSAVGGKDR